MKKTLLLFCLLISMACESDEQQAKSAASAEDVSQVTTQSVPADFNLTEVADGIFVHRGVHVTIEDEKHADIANIGFIIGDDCVAVIDTGGSIAIGEALRAAIKGKTEKPICYVINSHVHFDHVLGNAAFSADKPKFVGHRNLLEAMDQNRSFFLESFGADLGENPGPDRIIGPDLLVEDTLEIDLGNRVLLMTASPKAHTSADLTVLDKKTNSLWLADLLFMERTPSLDGSIKGWFALMEKLHGQAFDRVIPGHGPQSAEWPAAMEAQQHYFKVIIDETRKAIADGMFLGDAVKTIGQSEKDQWLLFDEYHQRAVTRTFSELEWE